MITISKIRDLQEKYMFESDAERNSAANDDYADSEEQLRNAMREMLTFEDSIRNCQTYITNRTAVSLREERDESVKRRETKRLINEYVDIEKPKVQKQRSSEPFEWDELKSALIDEIMYYGPITRAYEDDAIDEIRGNGPKSIFVESAGKSSRLDNGFNDVEHMDRIISKLIGVSKVRLTPKNPMVNARTEEGYRVNATYSGISPYNEPAFVLRKFSKNKITPQDMITKKSFSSNMYKLLALIPKADLSWITVGSTGSGKTTLNELMVREIDPLSRIITIENPSEMRIRREEKGKIINDVVQYESVAEDDDASPATMENLLINAMRQSPHWIGPGELRAPGEFATALRAAQTGHYFFTTLHAEGDEEAIHRFLTSYLMVANEPADLALRNICSAVKFVIFQEKFADGSRKVTSISEIIGSEGLKPIMNQIYRYDCTDVVEEPGTRKVLEIKGYHRRVGKLSDTIQQRMLKAGITKSRFEFLTMDPGEDEKEEYLE